MSVSNKFEKYIFSTFYNDRGVAKYSDDEGRITLKVENITKGVYYGLPVFFENQESYEKWIDNIVDDNTQVCNKALAVSLIIDAILA